MSTFCNAIANDQHYTVSDRDNEFKLLYTDGLIEGVFDRVEGKEYRCEYVGLKPVIIRMESIVMY